MHEPTQGAIWGDEAHSDSTAGSEPDAIEHKLDSSIGWGASIMRATKVIRTAYHLLSLICSAGRGSLLHAYPELRDYLPRRGAEAADQFQWRQVAARFSAIAESARSRTLGQSLGWMATAIVGAHCSPALPVSWIYMGTRTSPRNMISR